MVRYTREELWRRIRGPVYPIITPFDRDGRIDYGGIRNYVRYLNGFNVRTIMTTTGAGRFNLLTSQEIISVGRAVIEANKGKAIVLIGTGATGSTQASIDFARQFEDADGILYMYPERFYRDSFIINHFSEISKHTNSPIYIHTKHIPKHSGLDPLDGRQWEVDILDAIPNLAGVKESSNNSDVRKGIFLLLPGKMTVILDGGGTPDVIANWQYGVRVWMAAIGCIYPPIEERMYTCLMRGNMSAANDISQVEDVPFLKVAATYGWHTTVKASLNLIGVMGHHERSPLHSLSDGPREEITGILKKVIPEYRL